MTLDITSYDYRGHELVRLPAGTILVHRGDRDGPIVYTAGTLTEAMAWVNGALRPPAKPREDAGHV